MPGTARRVPLRCGRGAQLQQRDLEVSRQGRGSRSRALLATPRPAVGGAHSHMSSAPPRSPTPRAPKMKKDESFLGKLGGTLARKKKTREGECAPRVLLAPARSQRCPLGVCSLPAPAAPMSPPSAPGMHCPRPLGQASPRPCALCCAGPVPRTCVLLRTQAEHAMVLVPTLVA